MSMRKYIYIILLLIMLPIVSANEVTLGKLKIQEFDYFKCRGMKSDFKAIFENIYFNESNYIYFFDKSLSKIEEKDEFKQNSDFNNKYREHIHKDIHFEIFDKEDNLYHINTDGYWWTIYSRINVSNKNTDEIKELKENIKSKIYELKRILSWVREVEIERSGDYNQVQCHMSSAYNEYDVLFEHYNFYEYSGDIGCKGFRDSIIADCSGSSLYDNITTAIWGKKSFTDPKNYYQYLNRFIFLDKIDIEINDKNEFNRYGKQIVFSPSEFSTGFFMRSTNEFGYIRELDEIQYITKKITNKTKEVKNNTIKSIENTNKIDECVNTKPNIDDQINCIRKLNLEKIQSKLSEYNTYLDWSNDRYKEKLNLETDKTEIFYKDYFLDTLDIFLTDLSNAIGEFESNKNLYKDRQDFLSNYKSQTLSTLTTIRNNQTALKYTLIAMLLSAFLFLLREIFSMYGYSLLRIIQYVIPVFIVFFYNYWWQLLVFVDISLFFIWIYGEFLILNPLIWLFKSNPQKYMYHLLKTLERVKANREIKICRRCMDEVKKKIQYDITELFDELKRDNPSLEKINKLKSLLSLYRPHIKDIVGVWEFETEHKEEYNKINLRIQQVLVQTSREPKSDIKNEGEI